MLSVANIESWKRVVISFLQLANKRDLARIVEHRILRNLFDVIILIAGIARFKLTYHDIIVLVECGDRPEISFVTLLRFPNSKVNEHFALSDTAYMEIALMAANVGWTYFDGIVGFSHHLVHSTHDVVPAWTISEMLVNFPHILAVDDLDDARLCPFANRAHLSTQHLRFVRPSSFNDHPPHALATGLELDGVVLGTAYSACLVYAHIETTDDTVDV